METYSFLDFFSSEFDYELSDYDEKEISILGVLSFWAVVVIIGVFGT